MRVAFTVVKIRAEVYDICSKKDQVCYRSLVRTGQSQIITKSSTETVRINRMDLMTVATDISVVLIGYSSMHGSEEILRHRTDVVSKFRRNL